MKEIILVLVVFPIFYMVSGCWKNPPVAFIIATLYEVGFSGLILIYKSVTVENPRNWLYLILGFILVMLAFVRLETLARR